jgi:hypothetical protein
MHLIDRLKTCIIISIKRQKRNIFTLYTNSTQDKMVAYICNPSTWEAVAEASWGYIVSPRLRKQNKTKFKLDHRLHVRAKIV